MAKKRDVAVHVNHTSDTEPEDIETGLRPKELSFALYLATNGKVVESYLDAGYNAASYSAIERLAFDLASRERIKEVVQEQLKRNDDRYRNDSMRVLEELKTVAFSSIDDYEIVGSDVRLKAGVDKRAMKAVRKIKSTTVENHRTGDIETKVEIELWDKMKAIDLSMRHHGLLQPDMPPLEVVLARLPHELATKLRSLMINDQDAEALNDMPTLDEALIPEQEAKETDSEQA